MSRGLGDVYKRQTYGQGNDVFRLASWLYNQDEAACRTQQAAGTLWQGKMRPECRLHLV